MDFLHRLRHGQPNVGDGAVPRAVVEIDATSLSRVFSAPTWLRDLGFLAWFLVGVGLVAFGATWLLAQTSSIIIPVIRGG
jgi:hypothetical protein